MKRETNSQAKERVEREIWEQALEGDPATREQCLALFANPACWRQVYNEKGCHWAWAGVCIPPWEMAQHCLAADSSPTEDR